MTSTISALTTGGGGIVMSGDSSGNLSLLSGATTVVAVTATGATVTGTLSATGASTFTGTGKFATTIGVGNATPAASGSGITFPATQSASSDANTLDDYEEGTWTPRDAVGAALTLGTPAYYRKVGSLVTITMDVIWTTNTNGQLSGLPWTNSSTHAGGCFCYSSVALASLLIAAGATLGDMYNGVTTLTNPASRRFIGSFVYQTST